MTQTTAARPDVQDMVIVHRVFRRELRLAPQMVRAVAPGDRARAAVVAAQLTEIDTMLHHHHTGEDELVWPRLNERVSVAADLIARMERQHEQVGELLHEIGELLPRWAADPHEPVRDTLAERFEQLSAALAEHLDEEEREVLPLCEQHLTVQEWAQIGQRGMAGVPKPRLLVVLGHILEDASEQERQKFLSHVPPPARLAYTLVGRRKFSKEVAVLRAGIVPEQRTG